MASMQPPVSPDEVGKKLVKYVILDLSVTRDLRDCW